MRREIHESFARFQRSRFSYDTRLIDAKQPLFKRGDILEIDQMLLNTLTDYAVRTRYPGEEPTLNDAKEAMEIAKLIRVLARNFLGT